MMRSSAGWLIETSGGCPTPLDRARKTSTRRPAAVTRLAPCCTSPAPVEHDPVETDPLEDPQQLVVHGRGARQHVRLVLAVDGQRGHPAIAQ